MVGVLNRNKLPNSLNLLIYTASATKQVPERLYIYIVPLRVGIRFAENQPRDRLPRDVWRASARIVKERKERVF